MFLASRIATKSFHGSDVRKISIKKQPKTATPQRYFSKARVLLQDLTDEEKEILNSPREVDNVDVCIVGAGPSGLSAAIRLKQLANKEGRDLRVCILEKGAEVGAHILSGAVIEPRALNELIPDWKDKGAPLNTPVTQDKFYFMTSGTSAVRLPTPLYMQNHGNYIISLGNLCRWLGKQAEELGVEIYTGIAGSEVLYNEKGEVKGIATNDMGLGKNGKPTENFARGMELHARATLFGEGCRGSLAKTLNKRFNLTANSDPQVYGLGLKELWEVPSSQHQQGLVVHTAGWPMDKNTWGGSFMYHLENNQVYVGYVVGLDYSNPYLTPYKEFQRFKHHPIIKNVLEGGKCIQYGARALNEGGYQSIPKLDVPGGALMGCSAGFLNVPKIKGIHNAMKSGMLAAETAFEQVSKSEDVTVSMASYPEKVKSSWINEDLYRVRNVQPSFQYGVYAGFAYSAIDTYLLWGKAPWTFHHHKPDHARLKKASECTPIDYPKPDGKISFDLLTNLARSGTNHNEDQPAHLKLTDPTVPTRINLPEYASPETRYCPAGVYEMITAENGDPKLQINAQNCLHCKTCDIKDPTQNINYTVPEGGGGPAYGSM